MEYKKPIKNVRIRTFNNTFFAQDSPNSNAGSVALQQFENHETVEVKPGGGGLVLIPYHGIDRVTVNVDSINVGREDPYCEQKMELVTAWEGNAEFTYAQMAGLYNANINNVTTWTPYDGQTIVATDSNGDTHECKIHFISGGLYQGVFEGFYVSINVRDSGETYPTISFLAQNDPGFAIVKFEREM